MNKTYRTLWNETTQTYVAVAENVKSHGKKSGSLKTVSAAVAAALLTLSAGQAMAADVTVSLGNSPFITQILLGTGDNLIVDTNGVVEIPNSPTTYNHAVKVSLGLIAGSITNSGTILTNNTASHMAVGIYLDNGTLSGIITNSGIIEGGSNGGGYAIGLQSGSQILGGITNSGTLLGGAGIYLDGGSVIHGIANLGGTISGNFSGIAANHASVTADITNSGLISGVTGSGIALTASTVTGAVLNSGHISGVLGIALYSSGAIDGGIINEIGGTITGSGSGSNGVAGIALFGGQIGSAGITNSGLISGSATSGLARGIFLGPSTVGTAPFMGSTIVGDIVNHGTIQGLSGSSSGDQGVGIGMAASTINGSIINYGAIEGAGFTGVGIGLNTSTINGGITNSGALGSIVGSTFGLALENSSIGESIVNIDGARIEGQSVGIMLNRSTITGGITNSGALSAIVGGSVGIALTSSTLTGSLLNQGLISAGVAAEFATGINVSNSHIDDGVTNSGTIEGVASTGNARAYGIKFTLNAVTGTITNSGLISSSASGSNAFAVGLGLSGSRVSDSIINSGRILATATSTSSQTAYGIYLDNSSVSGGIINSGTITGSNDGISIQVSTITSGITNSGTIKGLAAGSSNIEVYGINLSSNAITGTITNSGLISATATINGGSSSNPYAGTANALGLNSATVNGSIINSGTIASLATETSGSSNYLTGYGIGLNGSSLTGSIINSGTINGQSAGISLRSGSTIDHDIINSATGTISGGDTGILVEGSTISGAITNNGLITAQIVIDGSDIGAFNNTGTLTGWDGLKIYNSTLGTFDNSNLIDASQYGVLIHGSTVTGFFNNSGTINASGANDVGLSFQTHSEAQSGVTNSGSGTISGGRYGLSVGTGSSIAMGLTNSGTIVGLSAGAGIYLYNHGTITGGLTNSGLISGDTGIFLSTGSQVSGGITNSNMISGGSTGIAISNFSTVTGNIVNSSIISGATIGIVLATDSAITGGLTNSGTISGEFSIFAAGSITGGIINEANGLLSGNLKVGGTTTVTNHGTIALPAGSNAIIFGDYTQSGTGILSIGISDDTTFSTLNVDGTVTLPSLAKIDVDVTDPNFAFTVSGFADVINAGTLSSDGTFAVTDNSNFFDFSAVKNGNTVDLIMAAASQTAVLAATTATGNNPARGAATVFDSIITGDTPIVTVSGGIQMPEVITLLDGLAGQGDNPLSDAVSQTLPLLTGGMNQSVSNALHGTSRIIQSRQEGQHGRSTGDEFFGDQHAWFKPFGSWANQNDRNGVSGFNAHSYGMVFGADAEVTDNDRVGIAFSYAHSNIDGNSSVAPQSANVSSYQLVGYGSHNLSEDTDINFQADIGQHNNKGQRNITFASTIAKSDYTSWTGHVGVGLAHNYTLSEKTTLTPSIRADYAIIRGESYTETGAGALNLNVNANTTHELILGVDSKLAHALTDKTTLTANIGVGYDTINKQASITSAFAGSPSASFVAYGLDPSPWIMRGGLGMVGKMTETVEISARYDIEARKDFDNQTASVKLRWAF